MIPTEHNCTGVIHHEGTVDSQYFLLKLINTYDLNNLSVLKSWIETDQMLTEIEEGQTFNERFFFFLFFYQF